jgi:hypothetical protein
MVQRSIGDNQPWLFYRICVVLHCFMAVFSVSSRLLTSRSGDAEEAWCFARFFRFHILYVLKNLFQDDLIGVVRLAIISFFLFVATSLRAANKFLGLGQVVGPRFFVYGITYVGATGVMLLMLFLFSYFALLGVHQQRGGGRTSSDMRVELLEESDTSSFFEGREVPKAYEV